MPFYEFRCNRCGHRFEQRVPVDERNAPLECPSCPGAATRALTPDFAFKIGREGILHNRHMHGRNGNV